MERAFGVKACGVKFLWCKNFWGRTVLVKQLLFLVKQASGFGVQLFVVYKSKMRGVKGFRHLV